MNRLDFNLRERRLSGFECRVLVCGINDEVRFLLSASSFFELVTQEIDLFLDMLISGACFGG